jgi:hypothetical protein
MVPQIRVQPASSTSFTSRYFKISRMNSGINSVLLLVKNATNVKVHKKHLHILAVHLKFSVYFELTWRVSGGFVSKHVATEVCVRIYYFKSHCTHWHTNSWLFLFGS